MYKDHVWGEIGAGVGNFLSFGAFPQTGNHGPASYTLAAGVIVDPDLSVAREVDQNKIAEYVAHSWYKPSADGKHPCEGETEPNYTGPQPPFDWLNTDAEYFWLKAPRHEDRPTEVGPVARMLVSCVQGQRRVKELVDSALVQLGVRPEFLFSTLGRTAARGIETLVIAEQLQTWLDELTANIKAGDLRIHNGERWDPSTWPKEARGWGYTEAPRGALGHWVVIRDGAIANYQAVVPTTWNASPRDGQGRRGAYEESLVGTPVADPQQPLEILRTIHSFDPCIEIRENPLGLRMGTVDTAGTRREVCLSCTPNARVGDYVIVHSGFAISRVDEAEARIALETLTELFGGPIEAQPPRPS